MKILLLLCCLVSSLFIFEGCAMFTAWKSIPAPGGCDQCHTVALSANWKVTYQAASVADERGRQSFQTPEYNKPASAQQDSPLENRKLEELACYECHKTPTPAHKGRKGRFHH